MVRDANVMGGIVKFHRCLTVNQDILAEFFGYKLIELLALKNDEQKKEVFLRIC